jgi:hypothetical protein
MIMIFTINSGGTVKKISVPLTAMILLFAVVGAYACGNHEKANVNSGKAEINGDNPQVSPIKSSDNAGHQAACATETKEVKVMTTEAHDGSAAGEISKIESSCGSTGKATKKSTAKDNSAEKKSGAKLTPSVIVSAPIAITAARQR